MPKVIGKERSPDWPKLGPAMLIATAMVVAIRTARLPAISRGQGLADVDPELDREVDHAARITDRVLSKLLKMHPNFFPEKVTVVTDGVYIEDIPQ